MKLINQNEIDEATEKYSNNQCQNLQTVIYRKEELEDYCLNDFKSGVSYAESELSELFIDFLIWYETSDIQNRKLKYTAPITGENFDIRKLAKEIFDIFLEERNKTSK